MNNTLRLIVFGVIATMATSLSLRSSENSPGSQYAPGSDIMPDAMNLTMVMEDRIMTMNLTVNPNIPPDFPVFAAGKDMTTAWTPSDDGNMFRAYEDRIMGASVIVRMVNQSGGMTKYMSGIFPMDGKMYSFSPADNALHDTNATDHVMEVDGTMYSMKDEGEAMKDFLCHNPNEQSNGSNRKKRDAHSSSSNGKTNYTVEVLMVIDFSIYRQWYMASTASNRNVDAQTNIMYYFAIVAAGMDMRYSTIQNSDFTMRIRLVGMVIAVDQLQSMFTDGNGIRYDWNYNTYTDAYKGLDSFERWVEEYYTQKGNVFDQATLFTGNFMYTGYTNPITGEPSTISGLGNIGNPNITSVLFNFQNSTIRSSSATINHDNGIYASIETASHELGHNLGSQHDGLGNDCLQSDQYIMASAPGTLTAATFNHSFTFSSCSIQYMSTLLRAITGSNPGNNLLQQSPSPSITPYTSQYPGQLYTVDQQCKQINGASSYYCGGASRDQTLCMSLTCWDATSGECKTSVSVRAYDGTTCGNRMWCMMGQCVSNSSAPPTNTDTCIYGDYKGPMRYSLGNPPNSTTLKVFCTDVATAQHQRCYEPNVASECCQTCGALNASFTVAGCPYGDRDPDYCRTNGNKYCYDNNFRINCCGTCAAQTSTPSSAGVCPRGDQNANYCSTIKPSYCYDQNMAAYCCSTCARYYTTTPGCEYGNKADWCGSFADRCQTDSSVLSNCCQTCASSAPPPPQTPTQNPNLVDMDSRCPDIIGSFHGYCYDMQNEITCGASCGRYKTSNSSCQYGDKVSGCSSQYCSTDNNRSLCCATCH